MLLFFPSQANRCLHFKKPPEAAERADPRAFLKGVTALLSLSSQSRQLLVRPKESKLVSEAADSLIDATFPCCFSV
jgi:hypothetical protein